MAFSDQKGLYRRFTRVWYILAILATIAIAPFFFNQTSQDSSSKSNHLLFGKCFYEGLAFLFAFSLNFGVVLWVTFIAGIVMYKNLPLHMFGHIQSKLFPWFFLVGSACGGTQLLVLYLQSRTIEEFTFDQRILIGSVASVFLCNVVNGLWFGPVSTAVLFERHKVEKEEGEDKSRYEKNPEYQVLSKRFGQLHGVMSLLNMVILVANFYILYWLADQAHELAKPIAVESTV